MSKIGNKPIDIPDSVNLNIEKAQNNRKEIKVKGKEAELSFEIPSNLDIVQEDKKLIVKRLSEDKKTKSMHGLIRSLINNAVIGVEKPWEKKLEVVGTGFNVKMQGEDLVFKIGYSHTVTFKKANGVKYSVEGNNKVTIAGSDKQLVGQIAYQIKTIRKPDPYKGKGIRYLGEKIKLKPGKKAKTEAA